MLPLHFTFVTSGVAPWYKVRKCPVLKIEEDHVSFFELGLILYTTVSRLVGSGRYDPKDHTVTIVADACPYSSQVLLLFSNVTGSPSMGSRHITINQNRALQTIMIIICGNKV